MSMIQIGMIAVIGAVLAVQMKSSGRAEYATCAWVILPIRWDRSCPGCGWIQDICLSC